MFDAEEAIAQREATTATPDSKPADWGIFEPIHSIVDLLLSPIRPLITSQVGIAVLFVLLAYMWMSAPRAHSGIGFAGYSPPERIAAYEEIWRREESALWDWLEDRVGLDGIYAAPGSGKGSRERQKELNTRSMGKKMDDERMTERQIDDAIRTTEEKLAALKEAVARKKHRKQS